MAKSSPGKDLGESILITLMTFVVMFLNAWVVMLLWGAFISQIHFVALPTIGYWAWYFGLNALDWVGSVALTGLGIGLYRIREAINGD